VPNPNPSLVELSVSLGTLQLPNPVLVASGTFGYAREMQDVVDLSRLGGFIPKTITPRARRGNRPWRTVETAAGMLNSIGLDNDGIDAFISGHLPYLKGIGCPLIVSIAGANRQEFVELARRLEEFPQVNALELNISCPNVSGGVDFGTDAMLCGQLVAGVRQATAKTLIAKLTPNVADVVGIARAATDAGADAISLINTLLGMAIDWRQRRPLLGNVMGGLSGPAIKPVALRCVYQVAAQVPVPVIGIGGIATIDDVMEFLVAGASAVQLGTVNFYDPTASMRIVEALPGAVAQLGATSLAQIVGSVHAESSSYQRAEAASEKFTS
jgi:dihydroorotate dehydrogenase (NAD+) catalytic subunit